MAGQHTQYVVRDSVGETTLVMRPERFLVNTAQLFSTFQDSHSMDFEDACFWFEFACKGGAVYG